jgi:acyl-CoA dehydrogenase family protein 9
MVGSEPPKTASFMKGLFNNDINEGMLFNFPFFAGPREDDFTLMSDSIRAWLEDSVDSAKFDADKKLPDEVLSGIKDMGLFGLIIPEAFGGSELNQTLYTRILELINHYDATVALTVGAHQSIGLKGLYLFGTDAQKRKYLPRLATGELIAAFALTEPTAGSDAAGIKMRAERRGDHYVLNGSKLWITNGAMADFFTVFAKEIVDGKETISAFLVTRDCGGVSHGPEEQKLGIRASSTVEVYFKDTVVPVDQVLGAPGDGFKIAMAILNQGRLGLAGGALGSIRSVLKDCAQYAESRKAFGKSIGSFGLIQNLITEITAYAYGLESMTYLTTHLVDTGELDYSIEAAICKVYGTEAAWASINHAMQIHGGNGYMVDYGLERKLRDCRIGLIFEGTNEILRLFIALTGLKEPATAFKAALKDLHTIQNFRELENVNTAIAKIGVLSEFALNQVRKSVITEKLTGLHSELSKESERLAVATKLLTTAAGRIIRTHGAQLTDEQMQLGRLANMAIDTYLIAAVLARIQGVLTHHGGVEKNKKELALAKLIIRNAKARVNHEAHNIRFNRDKTVRDLSAAVVEQKSYPFSLERLKN